MKERVREIINRNRSKPWPPKKPAVPEGDLGVRTGELTEPPNPPPDMPKLVRAKQPALPNPFYWNAAQLGAFLGLAPTTVANGRAGTNEIPRVKLGRNVRWKRADAEAFAERKHQEAVERLAGRRRFSRAG